jgi:hypothetical protein
MRSTYEPTTVLMLHGTNDVFCYLHRISFESTANENGGAVGSTPVKETEPGVGAPKQFTTKTPQAEGAAVVKYPPSKQ